MPDIFPGGAYRSDDDEARDPTPQLADIEAAKIVWVRENAGTRIPPDDALLRWWADRQSEVINGRLFLSNAVATGGFSVNTTTYPPAAELDGEPIAFEALLYALIYSLGNGHDDYAGDAPEADYQRARGVLRELGAPR